MSIISEQIPKIKEQISEQLPKAAEKAGIVAEKIGEQISDLGESLSERFPEAAEQVSRIKERVSEAVPKAAEQAEKAAAAISEKLPEIREKLPKVELPEIKKETPVYSGIDSIPSGQASDELTKGCLVLEGGAFRGVYTHGVLDCLMQNGLNFECVIGVSAGALNGMNYVSGQIGRSARANLRYRHDSRYVGLEALKRCGSILRLDFLLEDMNIEEPFNLKRFYRPAQRFIAVATNCETGETEYFEKWKCGSITDAIKASASMPYVSPVVMVDGRPCLDGGITCKVPFKKAMEEGYEKIVVVNTRERGFRKHLHPDGERRAATVYRKYPELVEKLAVSDENYNEQQAVLEAFEADGRLFRIVPSEPVTVSRLEKDMEKLGTLYWLGYYDTENILPELREYLVK